MARRAPGSTGRQQDRRLPLTRRPAARERHPLPAERVHRQSVGGCGFWDADANWADATALTTINSTVRVAIGRSGLTNVRTLELASTLNGRRLCEKAVGLYEEVGLSLN